MTAGWLVTLAVLLLVAETRANSRARDRGRDHDDWDDRHDDDDYNVPNCEDRPPNKPCRQKRVETVDLAFVGLGSAGINAAYTAMLALKSANLPRKLTAVAFDLKSEVGGVVHASRLVEPAGYDGSFGDLYGDMTAQRTAQYTLGSKRRLIHELGLPMLWTGFRSEVCERGRCLLCNDPNADIGSQDDTNSDNSFRNVADWDTNSFLIGSSCADDPTFVGTGVGDQASAPFPSLHRPGVINDSPGSNGAAWLLTGFTSTGLESETYDPTDYHSYGKDYGVHPLTGADCNDSSILCPGEKNTGDDWRTHIGRELVCNSNVPLRCILPEDNRQALNYEYVSIMEANGVGFLGDFRNLFGQRSYQGFNAREWNTNAVNGYLIGGERRLMRVMWKNATANGLKTYLNEAVTKIDEMPAGSQYKFRLESANRIVYVRKRLFMNTPPYYLQTEDGSFGHPTFGRHVTGSLVNRLRAVPELRAPAAQTVVRLLLQWAPGVPAWFWQLFDSKGAYSYRQYGDRGCFSRIEFIDSPYHRCTNHMVPVYSDDKCKAIWMSYYREWLETGDSATLTRRGVDELKTSFPELADEINAADVVHSDFVYVPNAWHLIRRDYDKNYTNEDVRAKAKAPLGASVPVSVIGESSAMMYEGWQEAGIRSVQDALERWASEDPSVNAAITQYYVNHYNIFKNPPDSTGIGSPATIADGSPASVFAHMPPIRGDHDPSVTLSNEIWWDQWASIVENAPPNFNWCKASSYGGLIPNTPRGI